MSSRKQGDTKSKPPRKKLRLGKETLKDLDAGAKGPGEVKGGLRATGMMCNTTYCPVL
jgi:hypothetical protein